MDREAFFTLHRNLPREGPGLPEDVHWALARAGLSSPALATTLDEAVREIALWEAAPDRIAYALMLVRPE